MSLDTWFWRFTMVRIWDAVTAAVSIEREPARMIAHVSPTISEPCNKSASFT